MASFSSLHFLRGGSRRAVVAEAGGLQDELLSRLFAIGTSEAAELQLGDHLTGDGTEAFELPARELPRNDVEHGEGADGETLVRDQRRSRVEAAGLVGGDEGFAAKRASAHASGSSRTSRWRIVCAPNEPSRGTSLLEMPILDLNHSRF